MHKWKKLSFKCDLVNFHYIENFKTRVLVLYFSFSLETHTMTAVAPPPELDFSINAEQVEKITEEIIAKELAVNDQVAALKPEEQTYENILLRLAHTENELAGTKDTAQHTILVY